MSDLWLLQSGMSGQSGDHVLSKGWLLFIDKKNKQKAEVKEPEQVAV